MYKKANTDQIKDNIKNMNLNNIDSSQEQNIDHLWETFKNNVIDIMNEHIPTKMINSSKKRLPWINKNIKALIRKRNKLFKRMKQHPNSKTTQHYKYIKHQIQRETRQSYWNYLENIICYDENTETSQKQKKLWNYISSTKKDSSGVAPLRSEGVLVDDTKQKAEILNKQYHSVFTPENDNEQIPQLQDNYTSMQEIHITINGTQKLLQNLDPTKATGPDEIPARILKQYAPEFAPHLAYIFNISLARGDVPTDWRQANVIPIFKKGENIWQATTGLFHLHAFAVNY